MAKVYPEESFKQRQSHRPQVPARIMSRIYALSLALSLAAPAAAGEYFAITVVDADTGRGVPLVELRTVSGVRYYTDSAGRVALNEPGLMNQDVFFHVSSHGYEFPKDGFGFRGKRLRLSRGGEAKLEIKRRNIAERLYRVTGEGLYRDSVLLGEKVPIQEPLLNGQVSGSDSVENAVYRGKAYWFWGDTNRPSYPLGNFDVPGATSNLPADGGLDPAEGIDLTYFVDKDGFARPTAKLPGKGPTWIDGLVVIQDKDGRERMFARYVKIEPPLRVYEQGLVEFDDETKQFEKVATFDLRAPLIPTGHPFLSTDEGAQYVYFAKPYPYVRVPATAEALADLSQYEAYTCFAAGGTREKHEIDCDGEDRLRFAWRRNTLPLTPMLQDELTRAGKLRRGEGLFQMRDSASGDRIDLHRGSVYWNEYRRRWIMIAVQSLGTSDLGEIWYSEAMQPTGPWTRAVKVVTHDKYSFYNPKQHPMFDQDGGRLIYFEGTYTHTFSGNPHPTPRYDYNQIMYRLDLADERLRAMEPRR